MLFFSSCLSHYILVNWESMKHPDILLDISLSWIIYITIQTSFWSFLWNNKIDIILSVKIGLSIIGIYAIHHIILFILHETRQYLGKFYTSYPENISEYSTTLYIFNATVFIIFLIINMKRILYKQSFH